MCMANDITGFLFERVGVHRLRRYLDLASWRHKLLAGNVANVATDGYKSRDFSFQSEVKRATGEGKHLEGRSTHPNHMLLGEHAGRPPRVTEARVAKDALNSVDIDREISSLATNELRFTTAARLLQFKFTGLSKAIKGE